MRKKAYFQECFDSSSLEKGEEKENSLKEKILRGALAVPAFLQLVTAATLQVRSSPTCQNFNFSGETNKLVMMSNMTELVIVNPSLLFLKSFFHYRH